MYVCGPQTDDTFASIADFIIRPQLHIRFKLRQRSLCRRPLHVSFASVATAFRPRPTDPSHRLQRLPWIPLLARLDLPRLVVLSRPVWDLHWSMRSIRNERRWCSLRRRVCSRYGPLIHHGVRQLMLLPLKVTHSVRVTYATATLELASPRARLAPPSVLARSARTPRWDSPLVDLVARHPTPRAVSLDRFVASSASTRR